VSTDWAGPDEGWGDVLEAARARWRDPTEAQQAWDAVCQDRSPERAETNQPEGDEVSEKTGAELIAAERQRQIDSEGWTPEHDDHHTKAELAWAATCYAAPEGIARVQVYRDADGIGGGATWVEPWPLEWTANANRGEPGYLPWRRPQVDRITELVKAGALIAAEIDRLRRAS
jgi:hypothetical protein